MRKPTHPSGESASILHSRITTDLNLLAGTLDSILASIDLSPALRSELRRIRIEISHLTTIARDELYRVEITPKISEVAVPRSPQVQVALKALTITEREILDSISTGATTQEIARARLNSEATVKTHLTSIYRKLSVRNRVEAVAFLNS